MIEVDAADAGLSILGGFQSAGRDVLGLPPDVATLVLLGWGGLDQWQRFVASPEYADGGPDPLDRWTRRVVDALASSLGATPLYPFGGSPWLPFQTWALAAGIGHKSPIGLLIHPTYGLWHSYRAALAFASPVDLPARNGSKSPCVTCLDKPCLTTCPVGAFTELGFAVDSCRTHIRSSETTCAGGCLARAACPVGSEYRYSPGQFAFHHRAFLGLIA